MSAITNIVGLSLIMDGVRKDIKKRTDIRSLSETLKAMAGSKENVVISLNEFTPEQWGTILETFGEFRREIHKLSENLSRFAIDKERGTITIIGNNNIIKE